MSAFSWTGVPGRYERPTIACDVRLFRAQEQASINSTHETSVTTNTTGPAVIFKSIPPIRV
jgi:hypothetical protein